ncbi:peptidase [Streptomyces carminius]|uniref:Peptidase n=1 Tax=Streptomyces carminius TaxID=2665496 RepID=A0A2M8LXX1_9ACTN|nr:S8 family serine peptidase [Streptomyces carminius]PJE96816.1 peptidase [Streptomyces carminius]
MPGRHLRHLSHLRHLARLRHPGTPAVSAGLAAVLAVTPTGGALAAPSPDTGGTAGEGTGDRRAVTLVTGDTVHVGASGRVVGIERAEGREKVAFSIRSVDGHTHVLPVDAAPLVARGKLDARLFDITGLIEMGYDDRERSDLPLIVKHAGERTPPEKPLTEAGAKVGRKLPAVNGSAVRPSKNRGDDFWAAVTDGGGSAGDPARLASSSGVREIRLDGRVETALHESVPRIGAPAAWEAGYDGEGVTVAVLDTGVDGSHPDLAGQVIEHKNFSEAPDTADRLGHGTHVASTVAGTGQKLKGTGVAPGVRLLDGKVLDDEGGGRESDVVAGMEWAVEQGAQVVNMSLGWPDQPHTDILEEAVNRLSAESDTLFVVAAGNEGADGPGALRSPGTAEAALTVGAVDKEDRLAGFSSRGPRTGDGDVKPDLTAPGAGIVAAVAGLFDEEGTGVASLDGTSMAAPHVAGAAALLLQKNPGWDGERLKSVLTGSTEPGPYTVYEQGTGRVDVATALEREVLAEGGPVNFTLVPWPHTVREPETKEVTYRNMGGEPVELELSVRTDDAAVPEGMFTVSPRTLTVPPGGTATAEVTADTRTTEKEEAFGGVLTAVSADGATTVRTALGVHREPESYDLTIRHLDADGRPAEDGFTFLLGPDGSERPFVGDEFTFRLPRGRYALESLVPVKEGGDETALLLRPGLNLDRDTTVTMDAREAEPVSVGLSGDGAGETRAVYAEVGYCVYECAERLAPTAGGYPSYFDAFSHFGDEPDPDLNGTLVGHIGPETDDEAFVQYQGIWARETGEGEPADLYHLAWNRRGADLGGFTAEVGPEDLAEVDVTASAPVPGESAALFMAPVDPYGRSGTLANWLVTDQRRALPATYTTHVLGGIAWRPHLTADGEDSGTERTLFGDRRTYEAGRKYREQLGTGVYGPGLPADRIDPQGLPLGAARRGDTLHLQLPLYSDGAGHGGAMTAAEGRVSLRAGGEEVFTDEYDGLLTEYGYEGPFWEPFPEDEDGEPFALPAEERRYTLTAEESRPASHASVSNRVRAEWSFDSARTPEDTWERLPLSVVRFSPRLSPAVTVTAGRTFTVPFAVEGAAREAGVRKLSFEVSYDEGRTWRKAKAVDGKHLLLEHPEEPGSVSLRARLTDRQGNTLVQTIERAYLTTG